VRPPAPDLDLTGLAATALPLALADEHRRHAVGAVIGVTFPDLPEELTQDLIMGAGYELDTDRHLATDPARPLRRLRTLPDTVGADMRALVVGLNPSVYSADAGSGFARPGNRFWPAALASGLVTVDRDPRRALLHDRVGMTDLVKRATAAASELDRAEYRTGIERLTRLVAWLQPAVVCIVGLAGWRAAVDRTARPGPQPRDLGGRPVYLMPNTSGLNAATRPADFVAHFEAALDLGEAAGPGPDR
jgi:TDG/mug DNA glycosylase family protein